MQDIQTSYSPSISPVSHRASSPPPIPHKPSFLADTMERNTANGSPQSAHTGTPAPSQSAGALTPPPGQTLPAPPPKKFAAVGNSARKVFKKVRSLTPPGPRSQAIKSYASRTSAAAKKHWANPRTRSAVLTGCAVGFGVLSIVGLATLAGPMLLLPFLGMAIATVSSGYAVMAYRQARKAKGTSVLGSLDAPAVSSNKQQ